MGWVCRYWTDPFRDLSTQIPDSAQYVWGLLSKCRTPLKGEAGGKVE